MPQFGALTVARGRIGHRVRELHNSGEGREWIVLQHRRGRYLLRADDGEMRLVNPSVVAEAKLVADERPE
jgi:hypothetical protein